MLQKIYFIKQHTCFQWKSAYQNDFWRIM